MRSVSRTSGPLTWRPTRGARSRTYPTTAPAAGLTAASTSFGMNGWPINTVMSAEGFPLRPWADEACEQAV